MFKHAFILQRSPIYKYDFWKVQILFDNIIFCLRFRNQICPFCLANSWQMFILLFMFVLKEELHIQKSEFPWPSVHREYEARLQKYGERIWTCKSTGSLQLTHKEAWEEEQEVTELLVSEPPLESWCIVFFPRSI